MLECIVLGDSIAAGTARQMPDCTSYSVGGYSSWQWNQRYRGYGLKAHTVIISLGTNDTKQIPTRQELEYMRSRVDAEVVYWIMPPIKPEKQKIVMEFAREYGDIVLPINRDLLSSDRIHPTPDGYRDLARRIHGH